MIWATFHQVDRQNTALTENRHHIAVASAIGPLRFETRLLFQPIGYRWAQNLRSYDATEPKRFVRYFEASDHASAEQIASSTLIHP